MESMLTVTLVPYFPTMSGPGERFHVLAQLDHLHSKYTGTGHADTTRYEWLTNQLRDTRASQV
ncbi:hypothetical protein ANCCAN_11674 [Ancylostoma caninum]|uniref:Uncharacterized protein n=1 Tax=Ancylostoma caninum TaxID=29170 RepID=A0A368GHN9_ANCCA|nr:hypothetical protein ANCCAN_11674 [Ancylostoma caninum]